MNRKGEGLTSAEIIGIVLVLAGLAIILAFIYGFKDSVTADDDICKLSVVSRATASQFIGGSGQVVPLQCTTKKICITNSIFGGSCSQFTGESGVQVVKVSGSPEQQITSIEDITAQAMYSCWDMMGRGKLDLFSNIKGQFGIDSAKATCVVCSRVAISDDAAKDATFKADVLNKLDMSDYLRKTQVPGSSLTYWQTFSDSSASTYPVATKDILSDSAPAKDAIVQKLADELNAANVNLKKVNDNPNSTDAAKQAAQKAVDDAQAAYDSKTFELEQNRLSAINLDDSINKYEIALVFMQLKTVSFMQALDKQVSWGAAAAGGAFTISPKYTAALASKIFTPTGAIVTLAAGAIDLGLVGLNTYTGQKAAAGYCGSFTSAEKSKEGCSLVQIMPYSFKDISQLCPSIQGNP